jgi:enoyl-CoA hydratase/carnithine racemase
VDVNVVESWIDGAPLALAAGEELACVRDGPVAHVVLNRPGKRNAINSVMWAGIISLMAELERDSAIRLVVLRGAGDAAFSAGADISEFREIYSNAERAVECNAVIRRAQIAIETLAKPTLAVIRGSCVGGGCGIALACDLRFATRSARFGIPPSRLGVAYSVPDTRRLVALVGPSRAKDMLFSGRLLAAQEALDIGLADRVVEESELERVAADYARVLLANSSQSIATAKTMVNALTGIDPREEAALDALFEASFKSADFAEGYAAFMEKRPPRFR